MYQKANIDGEDMYYKIHETPTVIQKITSGFYKAVEVGMMREIYLQPTEFKGDNIVKFKEGIVGDLKTDILNYFSKENIELYKNLGVSCKLGILLHGKQGTGKTTTAKIIMQSFIDEYQAIVLDWTKCHPFRMPSTIKQIKEAGHSGLIVIFVDEVDGAIKAAENHYLNILDGVDSQDNVVFIGCTNYLDKIPDRFKKRPSRFKIVQEINAFPFEVYKQFINEKTAKVKTDINWDKVAYAAVENQMTLDELKHVIVHMIADKFTFKKAYKIITFSDPKQEVTDVEFEPLD